MTDGSGGRGFWQQAWGLDDAHKLLNGAWHEQQRRHGHAHCIERLAIKGAVAGEDGGGRPPQPCISYDVETPSP